MLKYRDRIEELSPPYARGNDPTVLSWYLIVREELQSDGTWVEVRRSRVYDTIL